MHVGHGHCALLTCPPSQTHSCLQISSDHSVQQDSASESAAQTETDAATAEINGIHLADNKASPDATVPHSQSSSPASHVPDDGASESAAPANMDSIVEGLLVAGLHTLDDDDLPMQTNEFYSKAVLGCKPAGTPNQLFSDSTSCLTFGQTDQRSLALLTKICLHVGIGLQAVFMRAGVAGLAVDIKKSTYKNLAKLLKAFEKKVCGLCIGPMLLILPLLACARGPDA